jgi:hypothetical protein
MMGAFVYFFGDEITKADIEAWNLSFR